MACRGPVSKNVLLNQVLETVFQLRNTPFPGASVEDVWTLFQQLYPDTTFTQTDIESALVTGAKRGMFTRCMYPSYSNIYYFGFNRNMVFRNYRNRQFGLPIITDTDLGGSGRCGCSNFPIAAQLDQHGTQAGNYVSCCEPATPLSQFAAFQAALARSVLTCCPDE